MNRYIDSYTLRNKILNYATGEYITLDDVLYLINETPTEDVVPVVHAHWMNNENAIYRCSNCGGLLFTESIRQYTYCPHCGAKMDKSRKSEQTKENRYRKKYYNDI